MTRRALWKRLAMGAILIAIPVIAFAPPLVYFGKEIRGKVVDADTGTPLDGVSIVAEWQIYVMAVQPHLGNRLKIIETRTGPAGEYLVPGWGPIVRPPWGVLEEHSPALTFFKSGYYPKLIMNEKVSAKMIRESELNARAVKLRRFDGDFSMLNSLFLSTDAWLTGCWRECPQYVLALSAEAKRLRQIVPRGMPFSFPHDIDSMSSEDRDYFLRHSK